MMNMRSLQMAVLRAPRAAPATVSTIARRANSSTASSKFVKIVDVSPRDGLQNEPKPISTQTKLDLIDRLVKANIPSVEVTAFVSPKWVPQMADASDVLTQVATRYRDKTATEFPVLVPNVKGLERAIKSGDGFLKEIAIFGASSEGFSKKNTNCTIQEGLDSFRAVVEFAHKHGIKVRGYLSTVVACPYDGPTAPETVAKLAKKYIDELGCYELSLGDTIGVGTPKTIQDMLRAVLTEVPANKLAIHAHDTYGQGVANVLAAVEMGVRTVDASVAGLGGCPYAKGASGNVSTEDVVYALEGMGYETGIDLEWLSGTGRWITDIMGKENGSKAGKAIASKL